MNVKSVEKGEKSTATVVLEVEKTQFQTAIDKVYRKAKGNIFIPGFRKGKAPRRIIEGMYGANVFYEDAVNDLFPDVWPEAIKESDLQVVGSPSVSDLQVEDDGSLTLTVVTGVYPEVTLGQYKGITAPKTVAAVTEQEIDDEIDRLAQRNARVTTVDRTAQDGDTVIIDFEGFKDGAPFEGGKGENYSLKIGSGTFIPGFEEQLLGASAGEEKELSVTFPEDYGAKELAGEPVVFQVKVHEVKETVLPEKDDEFVKDVSETCDTMAELREELRAKAQKTKEDSAQSEFTNAVMKQAVENMTCDVPVGMVDERLDSLMQQYAMQMQQNGMTLEQYAGMIGTNVSGLRTSMRPTAETQVKSDLLLSKVADAEAIEVTDEELEAAYDSMAKQYEMDVAKVKEIVPAEELKKDKRLEKAQNLIVESAVVGEPAEAPAETPAEAPAEAPAEKPKARKPRAKKEPKSDGDKAADEKPKAKRTTRAKKEDKAEE